MSENLKSVPVDAEVKEETATFVVDWKALGKKLAIGAGLLLGGVAIGYAVASPADEYVEENETQSDDSPSTDES